MPSAYIETNAAEIAALMGVKERDTRALFRAEAQQLGRDVLADYRKTTTTWSRQVAFEKIVDVGADGSSSVLVGTDDTIYKFVDEGTRRHWVEPKRAKALRFQSGYRAKTSPGRIGSGRGGSFGPFVSSKGHWVSGITPRRFTKTIYDKHKALSLRRVTRKLNDLWGR